MKKKNEQGGKERKVNSKARRKEESTLVRQGKDLAIRLSGVDITS